MDQAPRDIFAIAGLPPEVLAVAMAKYSRSKESIRTTMAELTEEKSAEFHEKWVLGYGDASVADMAVIAIACENVSIIASKAIEDGRLASYQEKSTRYVDFDASRYHRPPAVMAKHGALYEERVADLFGTYDELINKLIAYFRGRFPRPESITERAYETKLKARSLDAARYLLPAGTLTNFGMIMSARSMRHMISKLLVSPYAEVREIAGQVRSAALAPAHNPRAGKLRDAIEGLKAMAGPDAGPSLDAVTAAARFDIAGAPTLIKHTDPSAYLEKTNGRLAAMAAETLRGVTPNANVQRVDYLEPHDPEDELVTTLLYGACQHPYRQILDAVRRLTATQKQTMVSAVSRERGPYDQPRREYEVGGKFIFDILMDYGAFRDLQRHRLCTQINQPLTTAHGFETPLEFVDSGLTTPFRAALERAESAVATIRRDCGAEADYLIPLAYRKRTLFKMDLRELYHMVELRSKPGGHMSYRAIVIDMYKAVRKAHPLLVEDLRAVTPNYDEDFFKR